MILPALSSKMCPMLANHRSGTTPSRILGVQDGFLENPAKVCRIRQIRDHHRPDLAGIDQIWPEFGRNRPKFGDVGQSLARQELVHKVGPPHTLRVSRDGVGAAAGMDVLREGRRSPMVTNPPLRGAEIAMTKTRRIIRWGGGHRSGSHIEGRLSPFLRRTVLGPPCPGGGGGVSGSPRLHVRAGPAFSSVAVCLPRERFGMFTRAT